MSTGPQPTGVSLPISRGKRYCTTCKEETKQTSRRCVSPAGRKLLWLTPLVIAAPCVHSLAGYMPTHPTIRIIYWVLPVVIAVILVLMATSRHAFNVRCDACGEETLRLTPPRWSSAPGRAPGSPS